MLLLFETFLHGVGDHRVIYNLVTLQQTGKQTLRLLPFGWTERAGGRRAAGKRSGRLCRSLGATWSEPEPPGATPAPAPALAAPPGAGAGPR